MTLENLTSDDLNLDAMPMDVLWEFWKHTNSVRPISFARQLFRNAPKGYVRATKDLGNYASNKATAMQCRLDGKINSALMYEEICDRIYDGLPDYARW
jgi:hypothetical protein